MGSRSSPVLVTFSSGVSPTKVKRWTVKILARNIAKTVTDKTLYPREHLHVSPTGIWLAPRPLTLDDPGGSKNNVKYVKNGNSYDVGPIGFTLDDLERLKVKVTNGAVTAIDMWGYTPVGLTGVLCFLFVSLSAGFCNGYLPRGWWNFGRWCKPCYLENGDRYEVGPPGALTCRTNRLSIGTIPFDLGWPWGSKIKVKLFHVKYVKKMATVTMLDP